MRDLQTLFTTLVSTEILAQHLADTRWAIVDCRFDLADTERGERHYREGHIPGAVYAHLDRDLSGPRTGRNGRHPLPDLGRLPATLGDWGIGSGVQVVAYDQESGMYASRLWWLLRFLGHDAAAVLDGGFAKWTREARPTRSGEERRSPREFSAVARQVMQVAADEVARLIGDPSHHIVDARAPERYRGLTEPLDPVAGHIPGAVNHFYQQNLAADGTFLPPEELRARFAALLGPVPPENAISYCGSGVTACHNLLALEHAGLHGSRLYPGSWSEWCSDPARPVERGS